MNKTNNYKLTEITRPTGVIIVVWLLWISSLAAFLYGVYMLVVPPSLLDASSELANNQNIQNELRSMSYTAGLFTIIFGIALGILGFFIWKGKRWARIVTGVLAGFGILGNISGALSFSIPAIISLFVATWVFIYLFFFASAKAYFA